MTAVLDGLLRTAAARHPDRPALVDGPRTFRYRELDRWSDRLAAELAREGVRRGDRVGIHVDKSAEAIAAIHAVLKAGACYVPLDPGAPARRLRQIAEDSGMRALFVGGRQARSAEPFHQGLPELRAVLEVEGTADAAQTVTGGEDPSDPGAAPAPRHDSTDLAYLLYTSGSTGRPKGVTLTHENGLAFVEWAAAEFGLTPADRLSSHAPLHFDLSVFDIFAAAAAGAALVLVPARASVFLPELVDFIRQERLTVWYSVPSVLNLLVRRTTLEPGCFPDLRVVLFAGEVMPTAPLRMLMEAIPDARFVNLYGPTETNVCTWYEVPEPPEDGAPPIPIGRVIAGVRAVAVADDGSPAGPGETGELHVAGPTVMAGYWNDPERTAQVLVPAARTGSGHPSYRTGDIVRVGDDGVFHYLGRRDNQVKSRGHRIELGEIEAAILAHPKVAECALVAVPDDVVTHRLWACVVPDGGLEAADVTRQCRERLPRYMVPDHVELFEELPRTSTGKTDRQALHAVLAGRRTEPSPRTA